MRHNGAPLRCDGRDDRRRFLQHAAAMPCADYLKPSGAGGEWCAMPVLEFFPVYEQARRIHIMAATTGLALLSAAEQRLIRLRDISPVNLVKQ
jgi:hypothetical protein